MAGAVTFQLEVFEGPLDLLLHLIGKNQLDIRDIPIALILEQYLAHIRRMQEFNLEVASEFITMAAQLMYIKSKMLLPVHEAEPEDDPRAALVEALLEYQQFKEISSVLGFMGELGRDIFVRPAEQLEKGDPTPVKGTAEQLLAAVEDILGRAETRMPPPASAFSGIVRQEDVPVSGKLAQLVALFRTQSSIDFQALVLESGSRSELVALFLAVLELSKDHKIVIEDTAQRGYVLRLARPGEILEADEYLEEADGDS